MLHAIIRKRSNLEICCLGGVGRYYAGRENNFLSYTNQIYNPHYI